MFLFIVLLLLITIIMEALGFYMSTSCGLALVIVLEDSGSQGTGSQEGSSHEDVDPLTCPSAHNTVDFVHFHAISGRSTHISNDV